MLGDVRAALTAHDPARGLLVLDTLATVYPTSVLTAEAEVLRIDAVLARGDRTLARTLATAFLAARPKSPYRQHVEGVLEKATQALTRASGSVTLHAPQGSSIEPRCVLCVAPQRTEPMGMTPGFKRYKLSCFGKPRSTPMAPRAPRCVGSSRGHQCVVARSGCCASLCGAPFCTGTDYFAVDALEEGNPVV
jgi:hypothetical protein